MDDERVEIWKAVLGYEGAYEVSNLGRVRSLDRTVPRGASELTIKGAVLTPAPHITTGYNLVRLSRDGRGHLARVAVLVCEAFEGPRPRGKFAAHRDGIRTNDCALNLRWLTRAENEAEKIIHGTLRQGEDVPWAVLNEHQVQVIRRLRALGFTYRKIAARLEVTFEMARGVCAGRTWNHVREAA